MIDEHPPKDQEFRVTPLSQKDLEAISTSTEALRNIVLMLEGGTFIKNSITEHRAIISEDAVRACREFLGDEREPAYQGRLLQLQYLAMQSGYR